MKVKINEGTRNERVVGEIIDNTFFKQVAKSKHLFRKLDAWGIDAEVFKNIIEKKNLVICVVDIEERKKYTVSTETFRNLARFYHFKKENTDHGAQMFLPRKEWEVQNL